jgi:NADP-dependent 3-hydroxy acid dehydrogenase YdfG
MSPNQKTILITGVSRGLGRAMTEEFIRLGHTVLGCGRSHDEIEQLQKQFGSPHDFAVVDVAADELVATWAKQIQTADDRTKFRVVGGKEETHEVEFLLWSIHRANRLA